MRRAAGDTVTVPVAEYRASPCAWNRPATPARCAHVELLHADASLTLTLAVTDDPYDIYADWQAWAKALGLPLLVVGQDGSVGGPLAGMGGIIAARPQPRRRHSFFAQRRPRFLARRKAGSPGAAPRIEGREIIARD